jgi:hypothetical protein
MRASRLVSVALLSLLAGLTAVQAQERFDPPPDRPGDRYDPQRRLPDRERHIEDRVEVKPIYRYYHPDTRFHLFTDETKHEAGRRLDWYVSQGIGFYVLTEPGPGRLPLYHFVLPNGGNFYATNRRDGERLGGRLVNLLGYIAERDRPGMRPLEAFYHPQWDLHFYTADPQAEWLEGWVHQATLGYVYPPRR